MRYFLVIAFAAVLVMAQSKQARAGDPPDKQELTRRVTEAARMLAGDRRFRGLSASQREKAVEFVTGNMIFVLGHEAGHAAIRELNVPVTGREEDAADIFATLMALMCSDDFADRVLANAALGWFFSDRQARRDRRGDDIDHVAYYDEHGMDLQRAYNVICLMVGSNMNKFAGVAIAAGLPQRRQTTCQDDYLNYAWSWEQVLKPHLRTPDHPKMAFNIVYGPGEGRLDKHAEIARHLRLLEVMADKLSDLYVWPKPISLEMQVCGEPNARWEFRTKRVVVCYELADEFAELYRKHGRSMMFSLDNKVSTVTPARAASGPRQKTLRAKRPVR